VSSPNGAEPQNTADVPGGGGPQRAGSRAAFVFIFVTVLLDFLAFGIIAPVLPNLIIHFEGGDISRAAVITGVFGFAWATMQFIFSPILGSLSDRYGRRPIILLSCAGLGFDYILMALAPSLGWLFVGRLISGITTSNISTTFAYVTDVTPPEKRAKQFGLLSAAFGLGFIIGPAVGGLLGNFSLRLPFWMAAGLSLTNALYGFFILPESLAPEKRAKKGLKMANPLSTLGLLWSHPGLAGLALVMTLYYLAHQVLPSVWVLYTVYRFHWSEGMIGLSLAAVGVGVSVVSGGLVGPIVKRFGERRSVLCGLLCGVVSFLGFGLAAKGWMVFAAIPFLALWGIASPSVQSMMSRHVDHSSQGKLQGSINSVRSMTGMFGPLIFTQVFALATSARRVHPLPGAPYALASLLLSFSLVVAYFVTRGVATGPGEGRKEGAAELAGDAAAGDSGVSEATPA
jgi:DHA1 family tetracycline resistance protein-like MFS transporter